MASLRHLSSASSGDSRRVSGSGEQSALPSPRELARPGSATHSQENGTSGEHASLASLQHPAAHACPDTAACGRFGEGLAIEELATQVASGLRRRTWSGKTRQTGSCGWMAMQVASGLCRRQWSGEARPTGSLGWRCAWPSRRCAAPRPRWPQSAARAPAACCPASSGPRLSPGAPPPDLLSKGLGSLIRPVSRAAVPWPMSWHQPQVSACLFKPSMLHRLCTIAVFRGALLTLDIGATTGPGQQSQLAGHLFGGLRR